MWMTLMFLIQKEAYRAVSALAIEKRIKKRSGSRRYRPDVYMEIFELEREVFLGEFVEADRIGG